VLLPCNFFISLFGLFVKKGFFFPRLPFFFLLGDSYLQICVLTFAVFGFYTVDEYFCLFYFSKEKPLHGLKLASQFGAKASGKSTRKASLI